MRSPVSILSILRGAGHVDARLMRISSQFFRFDGSALNKAKGSQFHERISNPQGSFLRVYLTEAIHMD
jgi:hypothetical protein